MTTQHTPLLGRLATRWFNEVIATDALRLLLDDPAARSAFLAFIGRGTSVDLGEIRTFVCERAIPGGRLDLEGVDREGRPRLIVEAKIGHTMSTGQISDYVAHQRASLDGVAAGVCALLVPAGRLAGAQEVVAFLRPGVREVPGPRIEVTAMSWEDGLDAIQSAIADQPAGAISLAADVAQLRAAIAALGRWIAPALELPATDQPQYWTVLLEHLSGRVPADWAGPLVSRDSDYTLFRYFRVPGMDAHYSVGLTGSFATDGAMSLWLRFHKATPGFDQVGERLRTSPFAARVNGLGGHAWLALTVDPGLGGPEQVEHVAAQVEEIIATVTSPDRPE